MRTGLCGRELCENTSLALTRNVFSQLSLLQEERQALVLSCLCLLIAGQSTDRILVGARFSAPVQTGPRAHPASYEMGTGSLPGLKWPGRGVDHLPQTSAVVKEIVDIYFYSPSGLSWPVPG
jgi:hypothetical protein